MDAPIHTLTSIETINGKVIDLTGPANDQVSFDCIAWALSRIARYTGHTRGLLPYSVAQHECHVAVMAEAVFCYPSEFVRKAMHHDGHEGYTGDVSTPFKNAVPVDGVREVCDIVQDHVAQVLGLSAMPAHSDDSIKYLDRVALAVEVRALMGSRGTGWRSFADVPPQAAALFHRPLSGPMAYALLHRFEAALKTGQRVAPIWRRAFLPWPFGFIYRLWLLARSPVWQHV